MRRAHRGFDGRWVHTDTDYDHLGRVARQSEPYYAGDTVYRTTHTYDLLGRVVKTTLPDYKAGTNSMLTMTYNGLTTKTTNGKNQSQTETRNALGEITRTTDAAGTPVTHSYDAWGQVVSTTTGTGNQAVTVTWAYDARGRRIKEDDPDRGVTTYAYNGFDELVKQTDAVGNVQAMTYDALGRLITRQDSAPDGADANTDPDIESKVTWTWDTAANGLGQLHRVSDPHSGAGRTRRYDALGRPDVTEYIRRTGTQRVTYYGRQTRDAYGRPYQTFDAARQREDWTDNVVEVQYNQWGYAWRWVDGVHTGTPNTVYRTLTATDARGQVTGETLSGGAIITERRITAATGRPTRTRSQDSRYTYRHQDNYTWDLLGNLTRRAWQVGNTRFDEYLSYDALNRLTQARSVRSDFQNSTIDTVATQTVSYDALGNITNKSDVGDYTYGTTAANTPGPHAVTRAGNLNYTYDKNGNVTAETPAAGGDPARTLAYTAANQVKHITKGTHTTAFVYGPDRQRVTRTDTIQTNDTTSATTTQYLGNVEHVIAADGSGTYKRYLAGGDALITQRHDKDHTATDKAACYLLRDHLGSVTAVLDSAGAPLQTFRFDAWGQRRNPDTAMVLAQLTLTSSLHGHTTTRGYTGHEMLDAVGIIHMNGRIYDPKLGRFLQADPVIQFPHYSQSQNRYSYVLNNPLTHTDPTGYFIGKLFKKVFKGLNKAFGDFAPFVGIALLAIPVIQGWVIKSWINAFAFGFATGGIATGSLRGALFGGISAAAFVAIGSQFVAEAGFFQQNGLGHVLTHGLAGGILAELQGGQFGHGFLAAGLSKAVMGRFKYDDLSSPAVLGRTAIAAVVGGTMSRITGGKFANGALTSAMAQLFNNETAAARAQKAFQDRYGEIIKAAGIDISQNMADASEIKLGEFLGRVKTGGEWDYKSHPALKGSFDASLLEEFGNVHFGIVAHARGYTLEKSLYGAGYYQVYGQGGGNVVDLQKAARMYSISLGGRLMLDSYTRARTLSGFSWGDNPGDSIAIQRGWIYAEEQNY